MDMSDSQFEFENRYDDEFYDDDDDDTNNQNDSGLEEKAGYRNSYDTISSDNDSIKKPQAAPLQTPQWKSKMNGSRDTTQMRKSDPYKSHLNPSTTTRRAQSDPRGKKQRKGKLAPSTNRGATSCSNNPNIVIQRVLSASRKKTSALHNVIYELQQSVEQLTVNNRDLRRNARIQDREIRKIDDTEAHLPMLMKKHSTELSVMQEKYKRQKEVSQTLAENIKKVDNELLKTKDKLKEYQSMVKERNLGERIELSKNIDNLEKLIEQKDNKISELTRMVVLQKKNHARLIKDKNERHAKAMEQINMLENVQKDLLSRLHHREKALEVTNIYSRRGKDKDGKQMVMFSPKDPIAPILKKCQEDSLEILQTLSGISMSPRRDEKKYKNVCNEGAVGEKLDTMVSRGDSGNANTSDIHNQSAVVRKIDDKNNVARAAENDVSVAKSKNETSVIKSTGNEASVVNKADSIDYEEVLEETHPEVLPSGVEETVTTFLTEAKSRKESLDLYDVDNGKEILSVRKSDDFYQVNGKEERKNTQIEMDSLGEAELHEKLDQMNEIRKQKDRRMMSMGTKGSSNPNTEKENIANISETDSIEGSPVEKEVLTKNTDADEQAKRRKLLLAKMQAIDKGENPNEVTQSLLNMTQTEEKKSLGKPLKKPIFLGGSPKSTANPKPMVNTGDSDDTVVDKKSDSTPTTKPNPKHNLGNSGPPPPTTTKPPPRRSRPPNSENESPHKEKERRDSWEFKKTDENLHQGLPSHTDLSPVTTPVPNGAIPPHGRNDERSFMDSLTSNKRNPPNTQITQNRINLDYNTRGIDSNYSPTALDTNAVQQDKKTNKKNIDLFQQFEDPFKSSKETKVKSDTKREGSGELFSNIDKNDQNNSMVSESMVIDDLEEMFIL